ncbi:MAG: helix-turn-helix domain-containing protein [Clostridiales Family XIII bacterium]|nr:helix-turn-helix domain-containing protein [Clostridiales Family XIII bacterium]
MDKEEALYFLCRLAQGIALMFGDQCETVVHEMKGNSMKNIAIYNGHVSGRSVNSTLSIYGNDTALDEEGSFRLDADYLNQLVVTRSGKQIKSSTFHLSGKDYHYALGINYDITVMGRMRRLLEGMTMAEGELRASLATSASGDICALFDACLKLVNKPLEKMKKTDKLALVGLLKEKGAFNVRRSVPYVAERLDVSKYTVYNYLNELEGGSS